MNPLLIIAIPLGLVILGMILNIIGLAYDQPPSSSEQDRVKSRRTNSFKFLSSSVLVHYLRIAIHNVLMVSIYPRMGVSDAQTDDQLRF
jgi:hypothetical protein